MVRIAAVLCAGILAGGAASAQQGAAWSYDGRTGPLNWGRLDPAYQACRSGKQQSPLDIHGAHLNKGLQPIAFHYVSGPMTLVNDGHTVRVTPTAGSYMVANGVRYDLTALSFQHPGEDSVKGQLPDMSVHFLHKAADGKMAVVAVRLNEGNPNALMAALWEHLPKEEGKTDTMTQVMNPAGFLPTDRGYWTYDGSLSEPPCTEGVRWFVMEQEVGISRTQLRTFAALYKVNSRMEQAGHGRKIEASE